MTSLLQVRIDSGLFEEVLLSTIGTIAVLVAVTVIKAVLRADTDAKQEAAEDEADPVLASRLSMRVTAQDRTSDPLNLRFTLTDPAATLLGIEISNQLDKGASSADCVQVGPGTFVAIVEAKAVQRWYNASPYWDGETRQLPIRVFLITNGRAVSETVWVRMGQHAMTDSELYDGSDFSWFLEGPYFRSLPTPPRMPIQTQRATINTTELKKRA
jgi:hypothetical protein